MVPLASILSKNLISVQGAVFTNATTFDPKRATKDCLYPDGVFRWEASLLLASVLKISSFQLSWWRFDYKGNTTCFCFRPFWLTVVQITCEVLRAIFDCHNVRRAPGQSGVLHRWRSCAFEPQCTVSPLVVYDRLKNQDRAQVNYMHLNKAQNMTPWPQSMSILVWAHSSFIMRNWTDFNSVRRSEVIVSVGSGSVIYSMLLVTLWKYMLSDCFVL